MSSEEVMRTLTALIVFFFALQTSWPLVWLSVNPSTRNLPRAKSTQCGIVAS
jgi:hypothetical protein